MIMNTVKKIKGIALNIIPIIFLIGMIPIIQDDYVLVGIYIFTIIISFMIKREKHDITIFLFGFIALTISEYFFIRTGVETFVR